MRPLSTLSAAAAVLAAGPALAQPMAGMKHAPAMARTGQGTGVVTAIDARAGTLKRSGCSGAWPCRTPSG